MLRRLTSFYDQEERTLAAIRTRLQALILEVFPDYDKSASFTFDTTGRALFDCSAWLAMPRTETEPLRQRPASTTLRINSSRPPRERAEETAIVGVRRQPLNHCQREGQR